MIITKSSGRLGNKLNYFIHGIYLHECTGLKFIPEKINGFINSYQELDGFIKEPFINASSINSNSNSIEDYFNNIMHNSYGLCIDFMFHKYDFFKKIGINNIKRYLKIENENLYEKPDPEDLVVHIRLGDYNTAGIVTEKNLYLNCINKIKYSKCYIVTDDPNNSFLDEFKSIGCIIRKNNELEDFIFLKNAKKIIISKSTFSWTAAYISDADEIYFPISDNKWPFYNNPIGDQADLRPLDLKHWYIV